jgi:hypothetical protein
MIKTLLIINLIFTILHINHTCSLSDKIDKLFKNYKK